MSIPIVAPLTKVLISRPVIYALGVATGPVLLRAMDPLTTSARSLLKSAIKSALMAGKTVQNVIHEAKEGISDLTAEAKADLAQAVEGEAKEAVVPAGRNA